MEKSKNPTRLEMFKGYTLDFRLREFRKVNPKKRKIEFVVFNSKKGAKLLKEYYT
ncbi:MAG: hypothetical protein Q8O89_07000 [Nanoarchaeota archaeon]|nr:hypothetical protein [Nanoarchaeota archaeon]